MSERENPGTGAGDALSPDRAEGVEQTLKDGTVPADADLDMPSDAMNDPEQLEDESPDR